MSTVTSAVPPGLESAGRLDVDNRRGSHAMSLTIATEAALFVILFFSYFFLSNQGWRWPTEEPPKLKLALLMLAILLASSGILTWGESQVKQRRYSAARLAMAVTAALGVVFLFIQYLEYKDHLQTLTPQSNAYGSIFYVITSFHAAHVVVGLLMLLFVLALPHLEPVDRTPYRPYHNASLYWHFVDAVWVCVVLILYVLPNTRSLW